MHLIITTLKKNVFAYTTLTIFLALAGCVSFFGNFGDEQENFVAGWLITKGLIPYKDFFFHHAPLPFYISAILTLIGNNSFIFHRIFILGYYFFTWTILLIFADPKLKLPILVTSLLVALAIPALGGQMFLADIITGISFLAILILYASYVINQRPPSTQLYILVTLFSFMAVWSSITIIIPFIVATALFFLMIAPTVKDTNQNIIGRDVAIFLAVHLIFPIYYFSIRHLHDFFWGVYQYNAKYYYQLRLAEDDAERSFGIFYRIFHQSWKYMSAEAINIFQSNIIFAQTIKGVFHEYIFTHDVPLLLRQIWIAVETLFINLADISTASLVALILVALLAVRKSFFLLFGFMILMITLRIRDNELFHLTPYYYTLFFFTTLTLVYSLRTKRILHSILSIITVTVLVLAFSGTYFDALTNPQPIIAKSSIAAADLVKRNSQESEKLLSIDGNPIIYQLSNRLPSTRYLYYYPWFHTTPQIRHELEQSIRARTADVIYTGHAASEYSNYFAPEIITLINDRYDSVDNGIYQIGER